VVRGSTGNLHSEAERHSKKEIRSEQIDAIVQGSAELNRIGTCYLAATELDPFGINFNLSQQENKIRNLKISEKNAKKRTII
jgi:hypothetical protein